jgi:hypothetical protein
MFILYAILILAFSALSFFMYVVAPKRRPAALTAFATPIGFGAGSILGLRASSLLLMVATPFAGFTSISASAGQITLVIFGLIGYFMGGLAGGWIAVQIVNELEFRFPERRCVFLRTTIGMVIFGFVAIDLLVIMSRLFSRFQVSFSSVVWYCTVILSLGIASVAALVAYRFFRVPVARWISAQADQSH